jgi:L-seryl-tRNA(Ser) seleniumtransferase
MPEGADARRALPQVERVVQAIEHHDLPHAVVVDAVRTVIAVARRRARRTKTVPSEAEILAMCADELGRRASDRLRPVINATGVVLHTNLGRSPLAPEAIEAVVDVARGYSNLEFDTGSGRRGDRYVHVEPMLAVATGAEAALVVNNNAAAVLLVCAALASGKDVVISRGELIEIGGEFRIPDVLATSGAHLVEVGTTNRTHLKDYARAIGPGTAFVLKVHPSNYRVVGFTASPEIADIAEVAHGKGVPLVYDAGSGLLRSYSDEPVIPDVLRAGADLVCFSGDKLFGGPQAGIVVGSADLIAPLRSHPLLRAIRPDKMQLAALGATVAMYLDGRSDDLPLWRMLGADPGELRKRALAIARKAKAAGLEAEVVDGTSVAGGGSLPGEEVATTLVRVRVHGVTAKATAAALRDSSPPVVARVEDGWTVLDVRTVLAAQDQDLGRALQHALSGVRPTL